MRVPVASSGYATKDGGGGSAYGGIGAGRSGAQDFTPVSALNPYMNKWRICVTVLKKSGIRTFSNARGDGKLFDVVVADEKKDTIKLAFFGAEVDRFEPMLQEDQTFVISGGGKAKTANKRWAGLSKHEYEITMDQHCTIEPSHGKQISSAISLNLKTIAEIEALPLNQEGRSEMVDIIAVVKDPGEFREFTSKAGKQLKNRNLQVVDQSDKAISLTVWGDSAADDAKYAGNPIVLASVTKSDYGGASLGVAMGGQFKVNPDIPQAHQLRGWWQSQGSSKSFDSLTTAVGGKGLGADAAEDRKTLMFAKDKSHISFEEPLYFNAKLVTTYVRQENVSYPACPIQLNEGDKSRQCNKKLQENGDGMWRCERCQDDNVTPVYRYMLSMQMCDFSGASWMSVFDEIGNKMLGMSADELNAKDDAEKPKYMDFIRWKEWNVRVKAKEDQYQDETRVRMNIMHLEPVDYVKESRKLLDAAQKYLALEGGSVGMQAAY